MKPAAWPQPPLRRNPARKAAGALRLETLVVVLVIGIVAALLLERLTRYQEYAERALMEATVANLRSGLRVRIAELMIGGRMAQLAELQRENPVDWLAMPPPNYGGTLASLNDGAPEPGHWYFDAAAQQLVYLPRRHRFFQAQEGAAVEVRLQTLPKPGAGGVMPAPGASVEGLALQVIRPYRWN